MRNPSELSRAALQRIVESIQAFLYLDLDNKNIEYWNPDKEWSGADVCQHVAYVLSEHDLVPEDPAPAVHEGGPRRYLLYDFDAGNLATSRVYDDPREAAQDASELDNVMVVPITVPYSASYDREESCDCEKPGHFCSGVPGILAHLENGRLEPGGKVERCDQCQCYPSDQAAYEKLVERGLA